MPVRAVLFDLGNTLWHIPDPPPVERVRQETVGRILALLRSWGIEPREEHRYVGRDIRLAIGEANQRAYESDCLSPDYTSVVAGVAANQGLGLTHEQAEELWHTWNLEGAFFGRRLFDDALETLATLQDRGFRLGCVTNRAFGGAAFLTEVDDHGLSKFFEVMSVSCALGYMKPHPKIFEHALDVLETSPQDTVMVGDLLRADVAGAQALGMTAVWRRHDAIYEDVDGVVPDYVVDELGELPELPCFLDGRAPT